MSRAIVVQHSAGDGPGWLGEWLPAAGVHLEVIRAYAGEPLPSRVDADALVVLGGEMSAYDDEVAPWLPATRALLRAAVEDQTPTLAICLGAQLLARATGGMVQVGAAPGPEIGVCDVRRLPTAADDPLLGALAPAVPAFQWHFDGVVELPRGAVPLLESTAYRHQAFRLGERVWGVQWHPEVTLSMATSWARQSSGDLRRLGRDPAELLWHVAESQPALAATWQPVAARFAAIGAGGTEGDSAPRLRSRPRRKRP